jgi:RecA-family ATPase
MESKEWNKEPLLDTEASTEWDQTSIEKKEYSIPVETTTLGKNKEPFVPRFSMESMQEVNLHYEPHNLEPLQEREHDSWFMILRFLCFR